MTYFDEAHIKNDTCPCCGAYTANGDVCKACLNKYHLIDDHVEVEYEDR